MQANYSMEQSRETTCAKSPLKSASMICLFSLVATVAPAFVAGHTSQQSPSSQTAASDTPVRPSDSKPAQAAPAQTAKEAEPTALILVHPFAVSPSVSWPYDMKQMQAQTVAELKAKVGNQYSVVTEVPADYHGRVYLLDGEITEWHAGNRAKRVLVGMGSGRESAIIHYSLTDESNKKVLDRKDTIRAEFWGNAYEGSVGQLAHPFADKIAGNLSHVLQSQ